MGTPIVGPASASQVQAFKWAATKRADVVFDQIMRAIYRQAPLVGVDPAVAVAQSAKETGYGRFGGVLTEEWRNTAAIKTTKGGANDDPEAHQRFPSWDEGARAHCAHLALYAGHITAGLARDLGDPRAFPSIHGTAKTVEALGGRWAPAADYGRSIVDGYLTPLRRTPE